MNLVNNSFCSSWSESSEGLRQWFRIYDGPGNTLQQRTVAQDMCLPYRPFHRGNFVSQSAAAVGNLGCLIYRFAAVIRQTIYGKRAVDQCDDKGDPPMQNRAESISGRNWDCGAAMTQRWSQFRFPALPPPEHSFFILIFPGRIRCLLRIGFVRRNVGLAIMLGREFLAAAGIHQHISTISDAFHD